MPYRIDYKPTAQKAIRKLDRQDQRRVLRAIGELADNPRPSGCQQLTDGQGEYRIRVGDYRVIYTIEDQRLLVLVLAAGHRKEIYRQWRRTKE